MTEEAKKLPHQIGRTNAMKNDGSQPMTDEKILETADMLARTWYDDAAVAHIGAEDLANIASIAAANVAWSAHGLAGIELLRLAADAMERDELDRLKRGGAGQ